MSPVARSRRGAAAVLGMTMALVAGCTADADNPGAPATDAEAHEVSADANARDTSPSDGAADAAGDVTEPAGAADASRPDTSVPDTSMPDTSVPDTSVPD